MFSRADARSIIKYSSSRPTHVFALLKNYPKKLSYAIIKSATYIVQYMTNRAIYHEMNYDIIGLLEELGGELDVEYLEFYSNSYPEEENTLEIELIACEYLQETYENTALMALACVNIARALKKKTILEDATLGSSREYENLIVGVCVEKNSSELMRNISNLTGYHPVTRDDVILPIIKKTPKNNIVSSKKGVLSPSQGVQSKVYIIDNVIAEKHCNDYDDFVRELAALDALKDTYYVPQLKYFSDLVIGMDYSGKTLASLIRREYDYDLAVWEDAIMNKTKYTLLPESVLDVLGSQLQEAIRAIHSRGIAHLDLKPENILVDDHLGLRVIDFGLSAFGLCDVFATEYMPGELVTMMYRPPECYYEGGRHGQAVDIWSFGVILAEMQLGLYLIDPRYHSDYRKTIDYVLGNGIEWLTEPGLLNIDPVKRARYFFEYS